MDVATFQYAINLVPRKFQKEILELAEGAKKNDGKLYVASPPGSGKTITALMLAARSNARTLVLAPNTAIQAQWLDKSRFFSADGKPAATDDPFDERPVTALTYQALARPGEPSEEDGKLIRREWRGELVEENGLSAEAAEKWLREYEERNPDRFRASFLRRWKSRRLADESPEGVLSPDAESLVRAISAEGVELLVFDECHHLVGYWAQVALRTVELLGGPRVLGLTATPPAPDDLSARELELHRRLLGEIDYQVPTPAVVKEGLLAPFQDLVCFTRPTTEEIEYIANCSKALAEILERLERGEGPKLSEWVLGELRSIPKSSLPRELRLRARFLSESAKYLKSLGLEVPAPFAKLSDAPLELEEKADLAGRYAAERLLVSSDPAERALFEELARAFRPLGFQLTEKGLRRCQSTVGRVLALSSAKTAAMVEALKTEIKAHPDARVLVITDFEKSSAMIDKEISALLTEESGGAVAAMRALTSNPETDKLDPILVTGSSVIVDDDLLPEFRRRAAAWFAERKLKAEFEAERDGWFFRIEGSGRDWNTRNYVSMVTSLFEEGATRCLVGTRGLLGEGWDSLKADTLIDLTTAATEMTVNQLRGRVIRLDPGNPAKTANIWDVVCMAPEFEKGLDDYLRFARKHAKYYGICDDGAIEHGLGHIHPALTDAGPEDVALNAAAFNAEMLERAARRDAARALWKIGEPYENVEASSLELKVPENIFRGKALLGTLKKSSAAEMAGKERVLGICRAVFSAMAELSLFKDPQAELDVSERSNNYYRILLDTEEPDDMAAFAEAVNEIFAPIGDQRYIIPRYEERVEHNWFSKLLPEVVGRYFKSKRRVVATYHPLPAALADSKKKAETFSDKWNLFVSPGRAVFAKRGKGEQILADAKQSGKTVENAKAKIKSVWK